LGTVVALTAMVRRGRIPMPRRTGQTSHVCLTLKALGGEAHIEDIRAGLQRELGNLPWLDKRLRTFNLRISMGTGRYWEKVGPSRYRLTPEGKVKAGGVGTGLLDREW